MLQFAHLIRFLNVMSFTYVIFNYKFINIDLIVI